ncbi:MAG: type II toxin-antitoxin system prevent-host-death family antitoxin [Cyanobacteria bacterium]|nr:type II toxin-antitoxin system prevent-host-death family antitoxin [Cyanobacteriota bacterium]
MCAANLTKASLDRSNLIEVNLHSAILREASFKAANLVNSHRETNNTPVLLLCLIIRSGIICLHVNSNYCNPVSMTRNSNRPKRKPKTPVPAHWLLQDAKARFSEVVRLARTDGPQYVTVHGQEAVVVVSAEDFRRLKGELTGEALVDAMQMSPHKEIEFDPVRSSLPVRSVDL